MTQQSWKEESAGDDVQMPLGAGGEAAPVEEYSAKQRPRPNGSTVALIGAFGVALVALYLLGLQNKPRSVSAAEAAHAKQIEETWGRALAAISDKNKGVPKTLNNTRSLVDLLTRYFEKKAEVPDLSVNLFDPQKPKPPEVATTGPAPIIDIKPAGTSPEEIQAAAELRAAAQEFSGLRLQLIMLGNPSTAIVNDKIVQPGTKFTHLQVDQINSEGIILSFKDQKFSLKAPAKK